MMEKEKAELINQKIVLKRFEEEIETKRELQLKKDERRRKKISKTEY